MSIKDITIVITSFKSDQKLKKCLNSIDKECAVINVENSDNRDHKDTIEKEFKNVKCILTRKNLGYGIANNVGLKEANTKYVLILNPDTELFPSTLENFLIVAKQYPDFAIIGPNIKEDKKEYFLQNEEKNKDLNYLDVKETNEVKGYAMFLNISQFKEIGFFDENIFIYLEEIDLCKRVTKKNKKIYQCSNIFVYHEGGKSHEISVNDEMELSRNWHWMWSSFYFNKKYKGFILSFFIALPKLISAFFKFLIYFLIFNKKKREVYFHRLSGLINSIIGKSSWYRPKI